MSHFDKTTVTAQYKPGQKIKVYLSDIEGSFKCTFGIVKSVDINNKPTITYKDLSSLDACNFNRMIDITKVNFSGKYVKHDLIYKYL